jgi:hypothetical protein
MEKHQVVAVLLNLTFSIYFSLLTGISLPTQPCVTPPFSTPHFRRRFRYPHSRSIRALPTFIRSVLNLLKAVKQGRRREFRPLETTRRSATSVSLSVHLALITSAAFTVRSASSKSRGNAITNTASVIGGIVTSRRAGLTVTLGIILHRQVPL